MITKEIEIDGIKFRLTLSDQVINQVNNLKSLYATAYEDPESFEQVSSEISNTINQIAENTQDYNHIKISEVKNDTKRFHVLSDEEIVKIGQISKEKYAMEPKK